MLLNFTVSNWKSFNEPTSLSMVASKEKQHANHIQYLPEYGMNVLPIAVVFGANASGKSNLLKAIDFAVSQITSTDFDAYHKETVDCFRLDSANAKKNSEFSFTFTIDDMIYRYTFSLARNGDVTSEKLENVRGKRFNVIYERDGYEDDGKANFKKLDNAIPQEVQNTMKGALPNKLALSYMQSWKVAGAENLQKIYFWFRFKLVRLSPNSRLHTCRDQVMPTDKLSLFLSKLDTSVEEIMFKPLEGWEDRFEKEELAKIRRRLGFGIASNLLVFKAADCYKFELADGALKCSKMVTLHRGADGELVPFELSENSDGTLRCLHLFPAFHDLVAPDSDCCYVIDELDRSLHSNLVKQLLASYLETRSQDTRSQLILTNHDIEQMDQDVLRRDEIWIAERDSSGATRLSSLDEFILKGEKIRSDRSLPKLYLEGRVGGVPSIESYGGLFD